MSYSDWVVVVKPEDLDPTKEYFLMIIWVGGHGLRSWSVYSRLLNGEKSFTSKPGIGVRFSANGAKDTLQRNKHKIEGLVAVEVPADADKRWRARKRRYTPRWKS